jgi:hypothetical protein
MMSTLILSMAFAKNLVMKFLKIHSLFVIALFFFSLNIRAGITSLGNGGGLAELQFIYFFKNSDQIVNICKLTPNCVLTASQLNNFENLKNMRHSIQNDIQIEFRSDLNSDWVWNKNLLQISQNWLYSSPSLKVRSDIEIMSFAIVTQLSHYLNLNFDQSLYEIYSSFKNLNFYKRTVKSDNGIYSFHSIEISQKNITLNLFVIEDQVNSFSLNSLFEKKMPLLNFSTVELYNVTVYNYQSTLTIFGTLSGIHHETKLDQVPFKITAQTDQAQHIQQNTLELNISVK